MSSVDNEYTLPCKEKRKFNDYLKTLDRDTLWTALRKCLSNLASENCTLFGECKKIDSIITCLQKAKNPQTFHHLTCGELEKAFRDLNDLLLREEKATQKKAEKDSKQFQSMEEDFKKWRASIGLTEQEGGHYYSDGMPMIVLDHEF